ncbi:hypothetical protein M2102_001683 [Fusobacterium sp. PH5-7]|uniref:hypothetical protein n=1 Tax=Fusobacterium sp. PH5-7 TaxID=2940528 RepID=UPI002476F62A|nr:hypothetical protein [Fusobacterium sp. PH5-7]MDH6458048.1 hypothetical protein [Fusobacterium sp. PH5-7]
MDTISIKITLRKGHRNSKVIWRVEDYINKIKSPKGYRYCDLLRFTSENEVIVKISYPRYYFGNNAYVIRQGYECLDVQEHFIKNIKQSSLLRNLDKIELIRVDIPFTYLMNEFERFSDYINIFKIMGEVYYKRNPQGRPKAYEDLISEEKETIIYSDSKTASGYNKRVIIYNQYLNLRSKLEPEEMERTLKRFPDLEDRMRIEVSKRIRRKVFSMVEFAGEDLFSHYKNEYRKYIFANLLNLDEVEKVYKKRIDKLAYQLIEDRKSSNFTYEKFILNEIKDIYDYEILRQAINRTCGSIKTRENAITTVRKIIFEYEKRRKIIIMKTGEKLERIKNYIRNF